MLPDREKDTLVAYLKEHVDNVEVVVMDMIHSFKAALRKALNYLTIIADCFHFTSYTLLGVRVCSNPYAKEIS
ncbi:transposase [Bacillus atrophaeus]|uniref:transposase n=1 Tax=Bacillus atrophaeus TaxID=1452 RepID=UPI00227FCD7D|nr:transposase [Bacillus atrophaeus]